MSYQAKHPVLIVDDDEGIIKSLETLFTGVFRPKSVGDAESAIELLRVKHFPVALVDISLPGQSGVQLLKYVRKSYPLTEVVMLTADNTLDSALDCISIGAYDYLTKPWDNRKIQLVLQKAIERSELTRTVKVLEKRLDADLVKAEMRGPVGGTLRKQDISKFSKSIYKAIDCIPGRSFNDAMEAIEEQTILVAMKANSWNQSRAAEALRLHRNTLIKKMKKFKIPTVPQPTY